METVSEPGGDRQDTSDKLCAHCSAPTVFKTICQNCGASFCFVCYWHHSREHPPSPSSTILDLSVGAGRLRCSEAGCRQWTDPLRTFCTNCWEPVCDEHWYAHAAMHYKPTLTIGGEVISRFASRPKRRKPKTPRPPRTKFNWEELPE